ncbi:MAG TPA: hypothetical protein VMQ61_11790 [Thermoanaerobaculia bacterium]|nr:hypothetical protein [Thermoanaerobaculia bacterium]
MKKLLGAAIAAGLLAAAPARAQFPGDVPETFRLRLGGIFASLDTTASLSNSNVPDASFDLNKLLGQPDHKTTFRGDGYWNFAGRSYLDFGFLSFTNDASKMISQDIHFGDATYTAGAQVASENKQRYIYGAYRYELFKTPSFHLGLSLGVSYTTLHAQVSASAGVVGPNGPINGVTTTREAEVNLPVPLIGAETEVRIAGPVSIGAWVRAFKANISPYSGSMVDAMAHVDWYIVNNFGLGVGYEYNRINIEKTKDTGTTKLDFRYNGPRLYLTMTF